MKSLAVRSTLASTSTLITLFLGLSACQPKDVDLKSAQAFNQFVKEQKATEMSNVEKNNLLAITIERSVEPLHYLYAALDSDYAKKNDLEKKPSELPSNSEESDDARLNATEAAPAVAAQKDKAAKEAVVLLRPTNTTSKFSFKIDQLELDLSGKLRKFVLIKNIFGQNEIISKKFNSDFKSQSYFERIVILPSVIDDTYIVKVTKSESASSKKDRNSVIATETKIKIIWDGQKETLKQTLKIVHFEVVVDRTLNKTGQFKVLDLAPLELTVQLGNCISINGQITIPTADMIKDQKITNPDVVTITDSSMSFSPNQQSAAAACEVRPVVDLSRML